jgi:GxxExxY protein
LARRDVPFVSQGELRLTYKGEALLQTYKPDFVCYGRIILELKAVKAIASEHKAQPMNYRKATGLKLGFLVNFGSHPLAEIDRIAI